MPKVPSQIKLSILQCHGNAQKIAIILAREGKALNDRLAAELRVEYQSLDNACCGWDFSVAQALIWADHATDAPGYYKALTSFLKGELRKGDVDWHRFAQRFGVERLRDAANAFKSLRPEMSSVLNNRRVRADDLHTSQQAAMMKALEFATQKSLHGFGPWLFCGPFKVLALIDQGLWTEPRLQEVYMPLGLHVVRGLQVLSKNRMADIDASLLDEDEPSLEKGGFGTVYLAHSFQVKLAEIAGSPVLHINSGLHVLGDGPCCLQQPGTLQRP